MARSKYLQPLDKRENKMKKKMGHPGEEMSYGHHGIEFTNTGPVWTSRPRIGVDTRIRSKTSRNSGNWLHAVGFVVLAAIVISWALSGTVDAVGDGVSLAVGDTIIADTGLLETCVDPAPNGGSGGAFAEYAIVPEKLAAV